jgi:hypothetical protein
LAAESLGGAFGSVERGARIECEVVGVAEGADLLIVASMATSPTWDREASGRLLYRDRAPRPVLLICRYEAVVVRLRWFSG